MASTHAQERATTPGTLIVVWAALVALAAASLALTWADPGSFGPLLTLAVATAKAILVAHYFMGLRHEGAAPRLLILLGVGLIGLILGLTFLDLEYR